jgi:hypothetical protein
MAFNQASGIYTPNSIFNDVGNNQIIIRGNVYISQVSAPEHDPGAGPPLQDRRSGTLSREIVLRPTFRSTHYSAHYIAARLIIEIVQLLMASDASNQFPVLKGDLNTLQQTLGLTGLATEAYRCTPLGRILADNIGKETAYCIGVLRELLSAIKAYQASVKSTSILVPWSRVPGSGCKLGEIRMWREKLSACQKSLGECLQVLDSCVFIFFHFWRC